MVRDGIGDADEDDALDEQERLDKEGALDDVVVLWHDPDVVKSPATPSDGISIQLIYPDLTEPDEHDDEPSDDITINDRLQPAPKNRNKARSTADVSKPCARP
jgi:hypothetical protein